MAVYVREPGTYDLKKVSEESKGTGKTTKKKPYIIWPWVVAFIVLLILYLLSNGR